MENINSNAVKEIERIIKENEFERFKIGEREFIVGGKNVTEIEPIKHRAARLVFSDLSSIVQILKIEKSRFKAPLYVNIESETKVSVITSMDDEKEREIPYTAETNGSKFNFGRTYDYESFVIAIRSLFEQTEDTQDLL